MAKKTLIINIEQNSIKILDFSMQKNKTVVQGHKIIELPKKLENRDEYIQIKLKEIIKENKWNSRKIVLNYYDSNLQIRGIRLPKIPKEEIEPVIRREVKKYYGEMAGKKLIYEIVGEETIDDREEYSIFYVLITDEYLKKIQNIDLKVSTIDFDVFAIDRLFHNLLKKDENTMIIDIGYENLKLYIYRGNNLNIYREVNIGGDEITQTIANFLQVQYSEAENLKKEYGYISKEKTEELLEYGEKRGMYLNIAYQSVMDKILRKLVHSIDYFKNQNHGIGIDKIYMCGGGSKLKNLKQLLVEELEVEKVELYSGSENFEYKSMDEEFFTDILHYTNLFGSTMIKSEIFKPEKSKKIAKVSTTKKQQRYTVAAVIMILLLPLFFLYYNEYKKNKDVENKIGYYKTEIAQMQTISDEYEKKILEIEDMKKLVEKLQGITKIDNKIIDILYDLSYITINNIYFEKIEYLDGKLILNGIAFSEDGFPEMYISHFAKLLEEKYNGVNIKSTKKEKSNKQSSFVLEIMAGGDNSGQ